MAVSTIKRQSAVISVHSDNTTIPGNWATIIDFGSGSKLAIEHYHSFVYAKSRNTEDWYKLN